MTDNDHENATIAELMTNGQSVTKAFRVYSRLTLEQVSEASGLSRMRLLAIEGGSSPTVDEVRRISAAREKARAFFQP
jgi:transcriptional regulator with XRE-family HTH domain